jgi:hypothetical protein
VPHGANKTLIRRMIRGAVRRVRLRISTFESGKTFFLTFLFIEAAH